MAHKILIKLIDLPPGSIFKWNGNHFAKTSQYVFQKDKNEVQCVQLSCGDLVFMDGWLEVEQLKIPNRAWSDFDYSKWQEENSKFNHVTFNKDFEDAKHHPEGLLTGLAELGNRPRPPFKPNAYYNDIGDQLEVYLTDRGCYYRWLCPGVSVALDFETDEIQGVTIESIKHIMKRDSEAREEETVNDIQF